MRTLQLVAGTILLLMIVGTVAAFDPPQRYFPEPEIKWRVGDERIIITYNIPDAYYLPEKFSYSFQVFDVYDGELLSDELNDQSGLLEITGYVDQFENDRAYYAVLVASEKNGPKFWYWMAYDMVEGVERPITKTECSLWSILPKML